MNPSSDRFLLAIGAFDAENARDPTTVPDGGRLRPLALVQAERLAGWVVRLVPNASEPLRLAARCQHIRRWEIPRSSFPEGRIGYLEWRKRLSRFHADAASEILRATGYAEDVVAHVSAINQKKSLKVDADVQAMEDALCLSFLEFEIDAFAARHPSEKVIDILRKTWRKMSAHGQDEALRLSFSDSVKALVSSAIVPSGELDQR